MSNVKIRENIAAVAIGRNEGERLRLCLTSLRKQFDHIVYVDSGSTDGSIALATTIGVDVIELDLSLPFTAARARNTGMHFLLGQYPDLEYIQFIDGDCELQDGWVVTASKYLNEHQEVAAICGRRRERYPEKTIYNLICDSEWNEQAGEVTSCGGDALFRVDALNVVSGFSEFLIAGEEPEMCLRMRLLGWKIMRLDCEMTLHDVAMTKFSQWWKRNVRAGYAYAEGFSLHGKAPVKFRRKNIKSIVFWALGVPLSIIVASIFNPLFLLIFFIYPMQVIRQFFMYKERLDNKSAILFSFFNVIGKWPQMIGIASFFISYLSGKKRKLIEYK